MPSRIQRLRLIHRLIMNPDLSGWGANSEKTSVGRPREAVPAFPALGEDRPRLQLAAECAHVQPLLVGPCDTATVRRDREMARGLIRSELVQHGVDREAGPSAPDVGVSRRPFPIQRPAIKAAMESVAVSAALRSGRSAA